MQRDDGGIREQLAAPHWPGRTQVSVDQEIEARTGPVHASRKPAAALPRQKTRSRHWMPPEDTEVPL